MAEMKMPERPEAVNAGAAGSWFELCVDEEEFTAYADALESLLRQHAAELERAMDLVRHQRHELHEAKLISDEEFAALVMDSDNGQRVARLEGYDALRAELEQVKRERDELRSGLFENAGLVTANNFAEMQQRAEKAEAQLQEREQKRVVASDATTSVQESANE